MATSAVATTASATPTAVSGAPVGTSSAAASAAVGGGGGGWWGWGGGTATTSVASAGVAASAAAAGRRLAHDHDHGALPHDRQHMCWVYLAYMSLQATAHLPHSNGCVSQNVSHARSSARLRMPSVLRRCCTSKSYLVRQLYL